MLICRVARQYGWSRDFASRLFLGRRSHGATVPPSPNLNSCGGLNLRLARRSALCLFDAVSQSCAAELYVRSWETKDGDRQDATVAAFAEAEAALQNRYHYM